MNTTDTTTHANDTYTTRTVRRLAAIAIVVGLAMSFAAAVAAILTETHVTSDAIFSTVGDYITAVGDALGGG